MNPGTARHMQAQSALKNLSPTRGFTSSSHHAWLPLIDIRALNAYSSRVRRKFLAKVTSLGWDEATSNREASYHSLMGILALIKIDNEYWIVNIVIPGRPAMERTKHPLSDFAGFDSVESFLEVLFEDKTRSYLGGLDSNELSRVVKFTLSSEWSST